MIKTASLFVASLLIGLSGAFAQVSSPTVTQEVPEVTGIRTEILTLPDPHAIRPGEPLMVILFMPEAGINIYSPGIVMVHGGTGGHPARQIGAPRFAGERLAAKGYTVLSLMHRHSRDEFQTLFEDIVYDIDTGLDFLEARGMQELVLAGHSIGSIRITYYQASTQDPRVKALVHFAPTADMGGRDGAGSRRSDRYEENVAIAQAAVAAGHGKRDLSPDPNPETALKPDVWIDAGRGYLYNAEAFLSHWGPEAKTNNSDWMPKVTVPMFMMAGTHDSAVPPGRMDELKRLAVKSPKVDHVTYPEVNHLFEKAWDQSVNDMVAWLNDIDLGPKSRVNVDIVDTRVANGRHLPGILYMPENGPDPDKPAFILKHGWTGDILHSSNHWLGWRLAQAGYVALAPETRTSGRDAIQRVKMKDVAEDLGHWVDFLEGRGMDRVIMEGHSAGGIWISNYMSETDDPRVIGMVYLAPTRNMPNRLRDGMGDKQYDEVIAEARSAVGRGEGRSHLINVKYLVADYDPARGIRSDVVMLAEQFLDYWGPDSRAVHTDRVREFDRPSLSIAGTADLLMTEEFIRRFTRAHKGNAEAVWYDGGSHGLRESKDRVLKDVIAWTEKTFSQ